MISCRSNTHNASNYEIEKDSNGGIKRIMVFHKAGNSKTQFWFDELGNIDSIKNEKEGQLDGQSIWFGQSGNIENIALFKNGKHDGAAFMFYDDGSLGNHRFWKNGKREGYTTDFYQDSIGTLKNIYFYNKDSVIWWRPGSNHSLGISVSPTK